MRVRSTVGLCLGGAASANGNAAPAEPPGPPGSGLLPAGRGGGPEIGCAAPRGVAAPARLGGARFAALGREGAWGARPCRGRG